MYVSPEITNNFQTFMSGYSNSYLSRAILVIFIHRNNVLGSKDGNRAKTSIGIDTTISAAIGGSSCYG